MPLKQLGVDILYEIVSEIASIDNKDHRSRLLNLSLTCRTLLHATRPIIFAKMKWPHQNQHDENSGLLFPPEVLWPYIKSFHLDWPDHWPDSSPPLWGIKSFVNGAYYPKHLDKVELALPKMNNIHTFQITCPFNPSPSLITALVGCPNIKDFKVIDTPLYPGLIPTIPPDFNLQSFSLVTVREAIRVGEGPFDPKFRNIAYFSREYRRKYLNDFNGRFALIRYLFHLTRYNYLRYLQLSGASFTLLDLEEHEWHNLSTLVLTGIPPVGGNIARLVDVIARMPKLFDLRLLFAKTNRYQAFEILPPPLPEAYKRFPDDDRFKISNKVFSQITHLAVSNACNLRNTFQHVPNLERLVISAIAEYPRLPIACSMLEIMGVLDDVILGGGNAHLKRVRLITEEDIPISLLKTLGDNYPLLEFVEVERCQYKELPSDVDRDWSEISNAFSSLQHLRELRIAVPRVGCNLSCVDFPNPAHAHLGECVRANRKICATHLATRLPTLQKVGLQYRIRTGDYRSEDRWLDYRIERLNDGTGAISLHELGQTWYPFPEVWKPVLYDD
ncbi:hypothetical protein BYT27DRAFT_7090232 [Phlegmacium glaucopus]|nr:hypothetical protein BYT27DRAFT_7090232 [Phlegmacium glaucopus]